MSTGGRGLKNTIYRILWPPTEFDFIRNVYPGFPAECPPVVFPDEQKLAVLTVLELWSRMTGLDEMKPQRAQLVS